MYCQTILADKILVWLVGHFGFKGSLRQYFSLYRAVSQREGQRGEKIEESKNVQTTPTAHTASAIGHCPTIIQIVELLGTGSCTTRSEFAMFNSAISVLRRHLLIGQFSFFFSLFDSPAKQKRDICSAFPVLLLSSAAASA